MNDSEITRCFWGRSFLNHLVKEMALKVVKCTIYHRRFLFKRRTSCCECIAVIEPHNFAHQFHANTCVIHACFTNSVMCERITKLRRNIADTDDAVISMRCRHLYAKAHRSSEKHKRSRAHTHARTCALPHMHTCTRICTRNKSAGALASTRMYAYTHTT